MRELRPGLWHWKGPHPEWDADEPWDELVSSYAIDDGERLLVFDPIAPPTEIDELASGRETIVVLTNAWHERDARSLVERLGSPVWVPPPDEGSPDVAWLLAEGVGEGHVYCRDSSFLRASTARSRDGSRTTSSSGSRSGAR